MSLDTKTIGSKSYFYSDYIFDNTALPNTDSATSDEFEFGGTQAGTEIVIYADTAITVADGQTLAYTLTTADESGGSFDTSIPVVSLAPSGDDLTIASGAVIGRYASNTATEVYAKLTVTASADQSDDKHTVVQQKIAH